MNKTNFGIVGLGVMGRSLAKNIMGKGFSLSVFNRMTAAEKNVVSDFLKEVDQGGVFGFTEIKPFVESLSQPRKILLMVNAGPAVDMVIDQLTAFLDKGDIIIDGGNSNYRDTRRRASALMKDGFHYVGCGVSGGERGALTGPSMMVGGSREAYKQIMPVLESIAAKDRNGLPCVALLGPDGSGHFVKTIHNGIEYAEMQLLAECYALLATKYSNKEISDIFRDWNQGALSGYLLEITAAILIKKEGEVYLLDKVLDKAGSKGTGSWSSQVAFQLGVPASMINAAVTARYISSLKEKRKRLARRIPSSESSISMDPNTLKEAYVFARIINHYQGFEIIKAASKEHQWNLNLSEIARIWTQGCIIKSQLMESLVETLKIEEDLMEHQETFSILLEKVGSVKEVVNLSLRLYISTPCLSDSFQYFIALTSEHSPANLIQAQRDEFGAHTYQRTDQPPDRFFTTNWTSNG